DGRADGRPRSGRLAARRGQEVERGAGASRAEVDGEVGRLPHARGTERADAVGDAGHARRQRGVDEDALARGSEVGERLIEGVAAEDVINSAGGAAWMLAL